MNTTHKTWVEINSLALTNNIRQLRSLIGQDTILAPCVKANAYGHGLVEASKIMVHAGADWLSVDALHEARALRRGGVTVPIYILGYVPTEALAEIFDLDARLVVYNPETITALGKLSNAKQQKVNIHLKVETGTHRQGNDLEGLLELIELINSFPYIAIEGISTHFANIEDTLNTDYYQMQLSEFQRVINELEKKGVTMPIKHCSASAAAMLFPESRFQMVRPGIACYGLWPSEYTNISMGKLGSSPRLKPVLTWKSCIAQVKSIPNGARVGYGCTYTTHRESRIAIVPVGYYDGYDRRLSNRGEVLVRGHRAPVIGRVCMNICMVDVTECGKVNVGDEVVLIGRQGSEEITAEEFATWSETINYEIVARINDRIPRVVVSKEK